MPKFTQESNSLETINSPYGLFTLPNRIRTTPVADSWYPRRSGGGGANPWDWGENLIIWQEFCQKLHENVRNWTRKEVFIHSAPVDPPMCTVQTVPNAWTPIPIQILCPAMQISHHILPTTREGNVSRSACLFIGGISSKRGEGSASKRGRPPKEEVFLGSASGGGGLRRGGVLPPEGSAQPPVLPSSGCPCSGRYASYRNAFLY